MTPPETSRLWLREMRPSDVDALLAIFGDRVAMEFYPSTKSRAQVAEWIEANRARYRRDGFGLWAVVLRESGDVIGDCGITLQRVERELVPEVGYHVVRRLWGRGYATEAAIASRDWFFGAGLGPRLVSVVDPANVASRRVAERVHDRMRPFRWERARGREMCLYETIRSPRSIPAEAPVP